MPATMRVSYYGNSASEPAGANAESGITFSLSNAQAPAAGTSPISVPTAAGTNFSWIMLLALECTATSTTSINNRTVRLASAIATGLAIFFGNTSTYRNPAGTNQPPASGSNGATPAPTGTSAPGSYTALTTSAQQWDNTSTTTAATGRKGNFCELVLGVDFTYAGGGGQASLPNLTVAYDEF